MSLRECDEIKIDATNSEKQKTYTNSYKRDNFANFYHLVLSFFLSGTFITLVHNLAETQTHI